MGIVLYASGMVWYMIRKAVELGVQEMPLAVGVSKSERRYVGGGETMSHVLFCDIYEENRPRDRGFIDLLVLGVDLLKLRGSKGEEGGNSRELKLVFDEYEVFMPGNLGKEE